MDSCDYNGDGKITFDEFKQSMTEWMIYLNVFIHPLNLSWMFDNHPLNFILNVL